MSSSMQTPSSRPPSKKLPSCPCCGYQAASSRDPLVSGPPQLRECPVCGVFNNIMAKGPPVVFINGKAMAQPSVEEIVAEYQHTLNTG